MSHATGICSCDTFDTFFEPKLTQTSFCLPYREQHRQSLQISQQISSVLQHLEHTRERAPEGRRDHLQSPSNQERQQRATPDRGVRHRPAGTQAQEAQAHLPAGRLEDGERQRDRIDKPQRDVSCQALASRAQAQPRLVSSYLSIRR